VQPRNRSAVQQRLPVQRAAGVPSSGCHRPPGCVQQSRWRPRPAPGPATPPAGQAQPIPVPACNRAALDQHRKMGDQRHVASSWARPGALQPLAASKGVASSRNHRQGFRAGVGQTGANPGAGRGNRSRGPPPTPRRRCGRHRMAGHEARHPAIASLEHGPFTGTTSVIHSTIRQSRDQLGRGIKQPIRVAEPAATRPQAGQHGWIGAHLACQAPRLGWPLSAVRLAMPTQAPAPPGQRPEIQPDRSHRSGPVRLSPPVGSRTGYVIHRTPAQPASTALAMLESQATIQLKGKLLRLEGGSGCPITSRLPPVRRSRLPPGGPPRGPPSGENHTLIRLRRAVTPIGWWDCWCPGDERGPLALVVSERCAAACAGGNCPAACPRLGLPCGKGERARSARLWLVSHTDLVKAVAQR